MLEDFLRDFVPKVAKKSEQAGLAYWLSETTGSPDAAKLRASLEEELLSFFNDQALFKKLLSFQETDKILSRQHNVLIRLFKPQMIPQDLIAATLQAEANLSLYDAQFRATFQGKTVSQNAIKEILTDENNPNIRQEAWEASKQNGKGRAPLILKLVHLQNEAAHHLGYPDYFTMRLELQEVDEKWLTSLFDEVYERSEAAYVQVEKEILSYTNTRFGLCEKTLRPFVWAEPFAQEDPIAVGELNQLVQGIDLIAVAETFYQKMGFDVKAILARSDQFERPGKNPHAFCMHIDREGDIRTLNNVQSTLKWLETLLHELGHAVYEQGLDKSLPWLLKEPPHMITTEAMALLAGRQAYRKASLDHLLGKGLPELKEKAEHSLKRRQLIFARFALMMTAFERELYRDPSQDLNALWWKLAKKYQRIVSQGSKTGCDWATKNHIGGAPVYYYSYLVGELFASYLEVKIPSFASSETGVFLTEKIFRKGNTLAWNDLIQSVIGKPLSLDPWLTQFGGVCS